MNRSPGILIFSTAYSLCLVAIICCVQIKYDARGIHNDKLIIPKLNSLDDSPKKPVRYVLQNPVTKEYPIQLDRPTREPSILIASLPAEDQFASQKVGDTKAASLKAPALEKNEPVDSHLVDSKHRGLGAWEFFNKVGDQIAESSFSLASSIRFESKDFVEEPSEIPSDEPLVEPAKNASLIRLVEDAEESMETEVMSLEPHLAISNDVRAMDSIKASLDYLETIQFKQDVINNLKDELDEIAEYGSLDASICETSLYRILSELELLSSDSATENGRLIDSVKSQITDQINDWLDLLNGISDAPVVEPKEQVDYDKPNTAIRSFLWKRIF